MANDTSENLLKEIKARVFDIILIIGSYVLLMVLATALNYHAWNWLIYPTVGIKVNIPTVIGVVTFLGKIRFTGNESKDNKWDYNFTYPLLTMLLGYIIIFIARFFV